MSLTEPDPQAAMASEVATTEVTIPDGPGTHLKGPVAPDPVPSSCPGIRYLCRPAPVSRTHQLIAAIGCLGG